MGILCVFCVYDTIGNRCFEKTSFPKTGDAVESNWDATIANALIYIYIIKLDRRQRFLFSNDDRVPQNILFSIAKKCNFAIKNDIFDCRKRSFAFFKNKESGSPGYARAYSVRSLTVQFMIVCFVALVFWGRMLASRLNFNTYSFSVASIFHPCQAIH